MGEPPREDLAQQSQAWCDRLAERQAGYFYDWCSTLGPGNGEDRYTELVERELSPSLDVLDAGCGHGLDALRFAPAVRSVCGYDRTQRFIELAERERLARGIDNVRFVCADSKRHGIPVPDRSIDLFVSRRGPRNWVADVPRAARPGAVLLMLSPITGDPPPWNDELPEPLRMPAWPIEPPTHLASTIADFDVRFAASRCRLVDHWYCEVEERFDAPHELYRFRVWGRDLGLVPRYEAARPALEALFARHAVDGALASAHRRWIFRAVYEG